MSDAIVVLNAGSSSIKFSVFAMQDGNLELLLRGQTEGLYTLARFLAKDGSGAVVAEHSWDAGQPPGHDGALQHLLEYLRAELSTYRPLAAVSYTHLTLPTIPFECISRWSPYH